MAAVVDSIRAGAWLEAGAWLWVETGSRPGGRLTFLASPRKVSKRRRARRQRPIAQRRATCAAHIAGESMQTRCAQTGMLSDPRNIAGIGAGSTGVGKTKTGVRLGRGAGAKVVRHKDRGAKAKAKAKAKVATSTGTEVGASPGSTRQES